MWVEWLEVIRHKRSGDERNRSDALADEHDKNESEPNGQNAPEPRWLKSHQKQEHWG
jgi:hypothetical protein